LHPASAPVFDASIAPFQKGFPLKLHTKSLLACMASLVGGVAMARAPAAALVATPLAEQALRNILVERVETQKWATGIVVASSAPDGRHIVSYGTIAADDKRWVNADTVFEIASLTKIFTALLLADMAHKGEVTPAAAVSTCLPAQVKLPQHDDKQITFIDLATHTSGLPLRPTNLASQSALDKYAGYTVEQLYQGLAAYSLTRDAGSQFEYSNWGYALLANALAHCARQSYEDVIAARITQPLGMNDTRLEPSASMRTRLAAGHDEHLQRVPNEGRGALDGAGGLFSTANDLLKFLEVFVGRSKSTLTEAIPMMLETRRPTDDPTTRMALGWRVSGKEGKQVVWSNGRADGYRTFMGYNPQTHVAVVALANAATNVGVDDIGRHVLDPRMQVIRAHRQIVVDPAVLDRYVGDYKFEDGNVLAITRSGDHLVSQMTDQGPIELFAESEREFFPRDVEAQIVFATSHRGPAKSLILTQDGESWPATRIVPTP
jgi:CubicO group peptidase (beta-lactamase class C family)